MASIGAAGCKSKPPDDEPTTTAERRSTRLVTRRQPEGMEAPAAAQTPAPGQTPSPAPGASPAPGGQGASAPSRSAQDKQRAQGELPPLPEEYADTARQLERNKNEQLGLAGKRGLSEALTLDDEREIGRAVASQIAAQGLDESDPELLQYLNLIAASLGVMSERPEMQFHVEILADDSINALSAPGGYVFVTRGAVKSARDEAELAAILAHEIAHLTLRHGVRSLEQDRYRVVAQTRIASMQEALGGPIDPDLERELGSIADEFEAFMKRGYSRDLEREADRVALIYLWRAGYQASALADFLESVKAAPAGATTLVSHPPVPERLRLIGAELEANPELSSGKRLPERFQARTRSLHGG